MAMCSLVSPSSPIAPSLSPEIVARLQAIDREASTTSEVQAVYAVVRKPAREIRRDDDDGDAAFGVLEAAAALSISDDDDDDDDAIPVVQCKRAERTVRDWLSFAMTLSPLMLSPHVYFLTM